MKFVTSLNVCGLISQKAASSKCMLYERGILYSKYTHSCVIIAQIACTTVNAVKTINQFNKKTVLK